jgi:hypothetical protein
VNERDLYPRVADWARSHLGCFHTDIDKGLRLGRIDVVGIRDSGGRLSGRSEVISIEVKRGTQPFATSVGQAHGYSIYADRCYLAEMRDEPFSEDERAIASRLGVGLVRISGSQRVRITEVVSAPPNEPLEGLRLEIIEKVGYSLCTVCGCLFQRGTGNASWSNVVRQSTRAGRLRTAADEAKGYVYWLREVAERNGAGDVYYHRRYVCSDCVTALFRD